MAFLPIIGAAAAAGGSILGGISSGEAASYQAQVARNNAITARQNAGAAASATSAQVEDQGLKSRAQQAEVKAGLAANGLDVNSGSAADVQQGQAVLGQLDTARTAQRGAQEVYGYETQATSYDAQAKLDQAQVGPDIAGGVLKGAGSLLSNTSVDSGLTSLLSGSPSVPNQYSWMQGGSGDFSEFTDLAG